VVQGTDTVKIAKPAWTPLGVTATLFAAQAAIYAILAAATGALRFRMFEIGNDFHYFYDAAGEWLAGRSPYQVDNFVTPPPGMVPALTVHWLPMARAQAVLTAVTIALLVIALWCFAAALGLKTRNRWGLLGVAALFVPAWMSLNGGNLDALMLVLLAFAYAARPRAARAVLLAASVVLKMYSALLVMVWAIERRWRMVAIAAVACAVLLLPFWRVLPGMVEALLTRAGRGGELYNISPAALAVLVLSGLGPWPWKIVYAAFWCGTFGYTVARSRAVEGAEELGTYTPWMIAAPLFVHYYCAILALPAFALLMKVSQERPLARAEWLALSGFLLLGIHPEFVPAYMGYTEVAYWPVTVVSSIMGGVGTTLLVIGMTGRARALA
jgi:hypothetical protein